MSETVKLLVNGEFSESSATEFTPVFNPSTGEQIAQCPMCDEKEVAGVIQAARDAFPAWRDTPIVERARVMFRLVSLMEKHVEDLARTLTREHGKTFVESMGSVRRGIEMIEFACGMPTLTMGDTVHNLASDIDCETFRYPLGVCASITPFNFPLMVPLWTAPIAITAGNTFILKPSEKVPLSAMHLAKLMREAGLPPGVFNVVHGDKRAVDVLLTHPLVKAVSFVGSTPIAKSIYETATRHGKRCQANGGAKNHILVLPDADIEKTVGAVKVAAFGCSGQRCMAGPLVVAVGDVGDRLVESLVASAEKMKVGPTDRDWGADMGPVVTQQHLESIEANIDKGVKEGAKLARDGRGLKVPDAPGGFYLGPTVSVLRVSDLDEAIELTNRSEFGNGSVIYTRDGRAAREFKHRAGAGMIGINIGVPAPMAMFPFTGHNASFFGDTHIQGMDGIRFYTSQKMIMSRWMSGGAAGEFVTTRG